VDDLRRSGAQSLAPRVRVVERGVTQVDRALYAGAVLRNLGRCAAGDVEVRLTAVDARGVLLEEERFGVVVIPARRTFNVGTTMQLEPGGVAARLRVEVSVGKTLKGTRRIPRVTQARVGHDQFGGLDVRAQVTNTVGATLSSLTDEFAVLRDACGRVVGGLRSSPTATSPAAEARSSSSRFSTTCQPWKQRASAWTPRRPDVPTRSPGGRVPPGPGIGRRTAGSPVLSTHRGCFRAQTMQGENARLSSAARWTSTRRRAS
jgi:hypothetical protein